MTSVPCIHIIGFGAIGSLIGVHLQKYGGAQVIPLFRSLERLNEFEQSGQEITIKPLFDSPAGIIKERFTRASCPELFKGRIDNLVVTCKTYQTVNALRPYMPFIDNETNIILIQNGLGVFELLKEELFVNDHLQPNLFQGVIGHGIYQDKELRTTYLHAGFVGCKLAQLPQNDGDIIQTVSQLESIEKNELITTLLKLEKSLGMVCMTYQELLLGQLEKFLINCCMNSVTSIIDCVNGELENCAKPIFSLIIEEALDVFRVAYKPLFQYNSIREARTDDELPRLDVDEILNVDRMVKFTIYIGCEVNRGNITSMRQDILNMRETEIDYINGYVQQLCKRFKLPASASKVNQTIQELVKLRLKLNRTRSNTIPN